MQEIDELALRIVTSYREHGEARVTAHEMWLLRQIETRAIRERTLDLAAVELGLETHPQEAQQEWDEAVIKAYATLGVERPDPHPVVTIKVVDWSPSRDVVSSP